MATLLKPDTSDRLYIAGVSKKFGSCGFCGIPKSKVYRVAATGEKKQAAYKQALEYQATLTKKGTVAKRHGK